MAAASPLIDTLLDQGLALPEAICYVGWHSPPPCVDTWLRTTMVARIEDTLAAEGLKLAPFTALDPEDARTTTLAQYGDLHGFMPKLLFELRCAGYA